MRVQRASLEKKLGKTVASELSLACLLGRLVRFTACLCLCLLSSFASLSRRKACTQRPASFEDGLSDFASSLSDSQGRHWWKKRSRIEAYAEFHWYAIFSQVISPPFKLNFPDAYESSYDRESTDYNGNQVEWSFCLRRPSEISILLFQVTRIT